MIVCNTNILYCRGNLIPILISICRPDGKLDQLVKEVIEYDLALRAVMGKTEMLIFPSTMLPKQYQGLSSFIRQIIPTYKKIHECAHDLYTHPIKVTFIIKCDNYPVLLVGNQ